MPDLFVCNSRQLVTLAGPPRPRTGEELRQLSIIPDGAIWVHDGMIQVVGTRQAIERSLPSDTEVVDAGGRIILPGFVDAHTHTVFAGNRADEFEERNQGTTYQEIAARGGGIQVTVERTRAAREIELLAAAGRYREWFLRGGTTTIEAKSGYGLSLGAELKILRVIRQMGGEGKARYVPTFLGAHEIPSEYRGRAAAYADLVIHEMLPHVKAEGLAEFCDVFCEPTVFPVAEARRILAAACSLGFGLRLHADQLTSSGGAELAAEVGATTADHLEHATANGLAACRHAGVQPVLLPGSVYSLGSTRYPAARNMVELGMAVVLASDFNPGSSPTASMPMVLSLACSHLHLTAAEAITAATINAAYSLNRGNEIGSLERGKRADFVIHDCDDYRELPYFFGRETAHSVYVNGVLVYRRSSGG